MLIDPANIAATPEDGGSGMSASEAADLHKKWTAMAPADVKIGSISPSRGGSGFFKEWYDACGGESCRMDFVTFHFYGMNIDALKAEVELYKPYGKPIWVTEVCRLSLMHRYAEEALTARSPAASTAKTAPTTGFCTTAQTRKGTS